ncbi:glypican-5-like [Artemia franciscana]|uniref:glypican-5-like n=1 Tax=Artemia franciscana TaxID=6661 RepID=UPI0032DBB7BA
MKTRLLIVIAVVSAAQTYPRESSCKNLKDLFLSKGIIVTDLPEHPNEGLPSSVCQSEINCCSKKSEVELFSLSENSFRLALETSSALFKEVFSKSADSIEVELIRSIRLGANKTEAMFFQLYEQVAAIARIHIAKLFSEIERSLTAIEEESETSKFNVEKVVASFFHDLYPKIYSNSRNGVVLNNLDVGKKFTDEFASCLRGAITEIRPFGEIPGRISATLTKSLEASRQPLLAIRLLVKTLDSTGNFEFTSECQAALVKSTYCAQCAGIPFRKVNWCRGLCMNVARGCLAITSEIDRPWNDLVEILTRVLSNLADGQISLVDAMNGIDSRLSEALLYALEGGLMFDSKIRSICGEPKYTDQFINKSNKLLESEETISYDNDETGMNSNVLQEVLQGLLLTVSESKGYYANVADLLCSGKNEELPPSEEDSNCWNGWEVGEYSKTIGGIGITEQKYNPEMKFQETNATAIVADLNRKLQTARQMLASKLFTSQDMDTFLLSDQGSGSGYDDDDGSFHDRTVHAGRYHRPGEIDDDDFEGSSGSGDGLRKAIDDEYEDITQGGAQGGDFSFETTTKKVSSGTVSVLSLVLLYVCLMTTKPYNLL